MGTYRLGTRDNHTNEEGASMTRFFHFCQNNSGGNFVEDDNVARYVVIEADNAMDANEIAQRIGIYFDGCRKNIDCNCCGDRWSSQWPDEEGDHWPMVFGEA